MDQLIAKPEKDSAPKYDEEAQITATDIPQPAVSVTAPEPPPDGQTAGYTALFSTLFLSLFDEFEQYIYRSVSETTGRHLSDSEMANLLSLSPKDRLRFVLENLSPDQQQAWIGTVLRRDILIFLHLKSILQSGTLSLSVLLQVCQQMSALLASQSSLSQILGTETTGRWRAQLESASLWVNSVSRLNSLPHDSIHSLLHGLFSNNLLPEWMNDLIVQADTVYRLLGQFDELTVPLRTTLEAWHQAITPQEKVTVFLEMVTDDALMEWVMPYLEKEYPDIAGILGQGLLIKQTFLSNATDGNTQEHLATTLNTLLDPAFSTSLSQRAGNHPPVPWLLDTLRRTADTLQEETLSMGALRTAIRLSDPTLSWGQFIQTSMDDVSVMQMAKNSLKFGVSLALRSTPWLDALLQGLVRMTESTLWQSCSRGNYRDIPLAIVRELHDDLNSEHSHLLPLVSSYLGDNTQGLLHRLNLLRQLLEAGAAGQSKSVMLALMVKSGRIGGAPDILTLIAEKTLHLSLLWGLWSARSEREIARLSDEFNDVLAILPDEHIRNIGAVMQWLPLLRDVYSLTGEMPALREGESPVSWMFRLNQQLMTVNTPASQAVLKRLTPLLPSGMTLSAALLRSINTSLSTITVPEDQHEPSSQQSLRQWLWDSLRSLKLSGNTVKHILSTLKNIVLTPRMAVALMIGYVSWALPGAQAAEPDLAGIPDPQQLWVEHEWILSENVNSEDFVLREQQAIELMAGKEGENYWQNLTRSSGLMALIFMLAASGLHARKWMCSSDAPSADADVEAGTELLQEASPGTSLTGEPGSANTDAPAVPGIFTRVKNGFRKNPAEAALWTLGAGMLLPTAYGNYRWHQTRQRNVALLGDIDPSDLIITVTPELLNFLAPEETENTPPDEIPLSEVTEKEHVPPAISEAGAPILHRTVRDTHAAKDTSDVIVSPYLSKIVEAVWGSSPIEEKIRFLYYLQLENLYTDPDRKVMYLPINGGLWRVTRTKDSKIMLLHNDDKSSTGTEIRTIPVHRTEDTYVWTTTFAITEDMNAITHLFSWDDYTPEFNAILKKNLFRILKNNATIEMSTVMAEMDSALETLFLGNYANIQLSVQILQARMELDLKIHNHETWQSHDNDDLLKQFYDKVNPSQMDNYARAMSFEISDRALFNEAFEVSITEKPDHITEKEKALREDLELQQKVIDKHQEDIRKNRKQANEVTKQIEYYFKHLNKYGSSAFNNQLNYLLPLEKQEKELATAFKNLTQALELAKEALPSLNKNLQDYQEKNKNTKQQLQNYRAGIQAAHQLISKKAPGLLNDNGVFNKQGINSLRFDLIKKELNIYDNPRVQYSAEDINLLQSLEAQKSYLLLIVNQQQITEQFHAALIHVNSREWHDSYQDILLAMQDAKKILDNDADQQDNNYRSYLLAATIYRMRKEKHPVSVVKNYSAWKTIRIFEKDREDKNPFTQESNPPTGFRSFSELKPNTDFETQYEYNQQFNDYRKLYSQYESRSIARMLFMSLGNKISTEDMFTPPKRAWYFEAYKRTGNFITIELHSGDWLFISSVDGQFVMKRYDKTEFPGMPALKILTHPDTEFGYSLNDKFNSSFGPSTSILDYKHLTYPYIQKTMKDNSGFYDPDHFRQFWMDFNKNPVSAPRLMFSRDISLFTIDGDLFKVTTRFLNTSLHGISKQIQENNSYHSILHHTATFIVPFYDVIYKSVTDSEYKLSVNDIVSIVSDSIMILIILATAGVAITTEVAAKLSARAAAYHAMGYSGKSLVYKTLAQVPKVMLSRGVVSILINTITDIIMPIPLRAIPSVVRGGIVLFSDMDRMSRYPETIDKLINVERTINKEWQVDVAAEKLAPASNDQRFRGIYKAEHAQSGTELHNNHYIRHENATYLVRWDEYARTWRVINPTDGSRLSYQTAVKFTDDKWVMHHPSYQSEPEISEMIFIEDYDAVAEPGKPDTSKTDTSKTDTSKTDTSKPGPSRPDTSKPDISKPDISKPDISKPDISKPDTSKTDTSKPGPSKLDTSRPIEDNTDTIIQEFIPVVKHKISDKMVESSQGGKFNIFFGKNKHTVIKGFGADYKNMEDTYFPEVIPLIEKGVDFSEDIIERALKKLSDAKKDPVIMKELQDYFSGALGTTNEKVISEAVKKMTTIAEESNKITEFSKKNKYENIVTSSSIRSKDSASGDYLDTFTRKDLLGKTVAFTHIGDEKNIISINGDMIAVGFRDYSSRSDYVGYTLLHETSHLASATLDIKYLSAPNKNTCNAEMIKEIFDEQIKNKKTFGDGFDPFINQVSKVNRNFARESIFDDNYIYNVLKTDSMLRANLMLSNADNVAAYLIDIANARTFNTDFPRFLEPGIPPVASGLEQLGKVEPTSVKTSGKRGPRSVQSQKPALSFNLLFLTLLIEKVL